jgi:hypothetical protein
MLRQRMGATLSAAGRMKLELQAGPHMQAMNSFYGKVSSYTVPYFVLTPLELVVP